MPLSYQVERLTFPPVMIRLTIYYTTDFYWELPSRTEIDPKGPICLLLNQKCDILSMLRIKAQGTIFAVCFWLFLIVQRKIVGAESFVR
jgi:hypothetical protein